MVTVLQKKKTKNGYRHAWRAGKGRHTPLSLKTQGKVPCLHIDQWKDVLCVSSPWHFISCYIDGNNSLIHDLLIWRLKESRKMAVDRYFIRQSHTVLASSTSLSVLTVVSLHPSSISHMPVSSATDSWSCQGTKLHRAVRRNTVHLMSF